MNIHLSTLQLHGLGSRFFPIRGWSLYLWKKNVRIAGQEAVDFLHSRLAAMPPNEQVQRATTLMFVANET